MSLFILHKVWVNVQTITCCKNSPLSTKYLLTPGHNKKNIDLYECSVPNTFQEIWLAFYIVSALILDDVCGVDRPMASCKYIIYWSDHNSEKNESS